MYLCSKCGAVCIQYNTFTNISSEFDSDYSSWFSSVPSHRNSAENTGKYSVARTQDAYSGQIATDYTVYHNTNHSYFLGSCNLTTIAHTLRHTLAVPTLPGQNGFVPTPIICLSQQYRLVILGMIQSFCYRRNIVMLGSFCSSSKIFCSVNKIYFVSN